MGYSPFTAVRLKTVHGKFAARNRPTHTSCRQPCVLFRTGVHRLLAIRYSYRAERTTVHCTERKVGNITADIVRVSRNR